MNPDSTPAPDTRQPLIRSHKAENHFDLWRWLDICPHSQTMQAYDLDRRESLLYALPCNEWSCRHCAVRKTRALAHRTEKAKPNRLVTLTVDPKLFTSPRAAFDATRRELPEWTKRIRKRFGEYEYLRVTEVTKAGWPHYHMLARSRYIPHAVARDMWWDLTGARIVDVRQVKDSFRCYQYLLKYLTKMHHIEWTGRHVSYSRGFFKPEDDPQFRNHRLVNKVLTAKHPAKVIFEYWHGHDVDQVTPRSWRCVDGHLPDPRHPPSLDAQSDLFDHSPQVDADEKPSTYLADFIRRSTEGP